MQKASFSTGAEAGGGRHALETTRRGVFAIGDVRATSVKRVASAVGEGARGGRWHRDTAPTWRAPS